MSIWILKQRSRTRRNGKWGEWETVYGNHYYKERPVKDEINHLYYERRAFEFAEVRECKSEIT